MTVGLMDIGTNSVRLLIPDPDDLLNSSKYLRVTRIGEGVNQNRRLSDAAMDRTLAGIGELLEIAGARGIHEIHAMATSAVRDADNRDVFVKRLQDEFDISLEIISGEEEARLGYLGAIQGFGFDLEEVLVVDIGGGSTELIHLKGGTLEKMKSFDIGAVRLTEIFDPADPPRQDEMDRMAAYAEGILGDFVEGFRGEVLGIGGTITTLAAVDMALAVYDRKRIHASRITAEKISKIYRDLMVLDKRRRKEVVGLDPLRADIILSGMVILKVLMEKAGVSSVLVSDFDNLEGYFSRRLMIDKV